jgi:phenylacetate-coenzyme A ligase PaaK-like adenylate-forming protein
VYSEEDFATWVAVWLRSLARLGVTPESRIAGIGAPSPLHVSKQLAAAIVGEQPGAPELSVVTPLDELVDALNAGDPDTIVTYSSIAGLLADEQLEGRLRISPARVVVTSEVVTPEVRRRIAAAWGAPPLEVYATTEAPLVASSGPERGGMHVADDFVIVEVVDEENRPVPPGEAGAKLLLTNLVNRAQPLIRYELSDAVVLEPGADPSGRPYTRIASIDGRSDDILRMPGRDGREVTVHPYRMHVPFTARPEVRQYQVVHDGSGLHVRVVLRPDAPRDAVERIRVAFLAELEAIGALPPPVEVTAVPSIDREGGDAAKYKLIKAA